MFDTHHQERGTTLKFSDLGKADRRLVIKHVRFHVNELREHYERWNEDAQEWREKGYKPHYCVHGCNLWVDHDIPCGQCEEHGSEFDAVSITRWCLDGALADMEKSHERRAAMQELFRLGAPLNDDLFAWPYEPFKEFF